MRRSRAHGEYPLNVKALIRELQRYPADYEVDVCMICSELDHAVIAEVEGVDSGGIGHSAGRLRLEATTEAVKADVEDDERRRRFR